MWKTDFGHFGLDQDVGQYLSSVILFLKNVICLAFLATNCSFLQDVDNVY